MDLFMFLSRIPVPTYSSGSKFLTDSRVDIKICCNESCLLLFYLIPAGVVLHLEYIAVYGYLLMLWRIDVQGRIPVTPYSRCVFVVLKCNELWMPCYI